MLSIKMAPNGSKFLLNEHQEQSSNAMGDVTVTKGALLHFYPNKRFGLYPKLYRRFNADDLYAITMDGEAADTDDQIHCLNDLTGLRFLDVRGTDITADAIPDLNKLNLSILRLGKGIDGKDLTKFDKLKALNTIEFAGTNHVSQALTPLKLSRSLKELRLTGVALSRADLEQISKIPKLERIELDSVAMPEDALTALAKMRGLKSVIVTRSKLSPVWVKVFDDQKSPATITIFRSDWSEEAVETMRRLRSGLRIIDGDEMSAPLDWGMQPTSSSE